MYIRPMDLSGEADPYLVVRLGENVIKDKKNMQRETLNPLFGSFFEFETVLPLQNELHVEVWDHDDMTKDDLIGITTIDIEDRFYSRYLGSCGLPKVYEKFGVNAWRLLQTPTKILQDLTQRGFTFKKIQSKNDREGLPAPSYPEPTDDKLKLDGNLEISIEMEGHFGTVSSGSVPWTVKSPSGQYSYSNEHMALSLLHKWEELAGYSLVPEHIEHRNLLHPKQGDSHMGIVQMWVDIFPTDVVSPLPEPVDVALREPVEYELRVVIHDCAGVSLDDINPLTGEKSSDIFFKGCLDGLDSDMQSTDVHYMSMDGEGSFNWRMIFRFNYLEAEQKILKKTRQFGALAKYAQKYLPQPLIPGIFRGATMEKLEPLLKVSVWDDDIVSGDDCIGEILLDLSNLRKGRKTAEKLEKTWQSYICSSGDGLNSENEDSYRIDLFSEKSPTIRSWWPLLEKHSDSPSDEEQPGCCKRIFCCCCRKREKKIAVPPAGSIEAQVGYWELKGMVDVEIELLKADDADKDPAGLGRDNPKGLVAPVRPHDTFLAMLNPLRTIKIIWNRFKWFFFTILIIALLALLIAIFVYNFPNYMAMKLVSP